MDRVEVEKIIDYYFNRKQLIEGNNKPDYSCNKGGSISKSYKGIRSYQIEEVVFDALSLKDIECDEYSICSEYRFRSSSILQYYLLSIEQLINYFGFRTSLQNGRLPINNYRCFITLYLMEVLNGIFGSNFNDKFDILIKVTDIYSYENKVGIFKKILQSAFELLYLQHMDKIDKLKYFSEAPFPIFKKTSLALDNSIVNDDEFSIYSIFAVTYKADKRNRNWKKVMNYSGDCLKFVYFKLQSEGNFILDEYNSIADLFYIYGNIQIDSTINGMKILFPVTRDFYYCSDSGDKELFQDGIHTHTTLFTLEKQKIFMDLFIKAVYISMKLHRSKKSNSESGIDSLIPRAKDLYDNPEDGRNPIRINKIELRNLYTRINIAVGHWLDNNELMAKNNANINSYQIYDLDMKDVDEVRDKSREIQAKLIIEEEEDQLLSAAESSIEVLCKDKILEKCTIKSLILALSQCEKEVLISLISNDINKAESIAFNDGQPLSVVIDNINNLSDAHIEDIVIEGNEVLADYRADIEDELKN